jgi:hypothetical protein
MAELLSMGVDIGSTTVKIAIRDDNGEVLFADYERHFANIQQTLALLIGRAMEKLGDREVCPMITGSGGLLVCSKSDVSRLLADVINDLIIIAVSDVTQYSSGYCNRIEACLCCDLSGDEDDHLASGCFNAAAAVWILSQTFIKDGCRYLIADLVRMSSEDDFVTE